MPLADGADTAEASELTDERPALLLGRSGELVGALSDEPRDALVGDPLDELERGLGPRDRERAIRAPDAEAVRGTADFRSVRSGVAETAMNAAEFRAVGKPTG